MANKIEIPRSNPVKVYEVDRSQSSQYFTKHFYDYLLSERIKQYPSIEQSKYCQIYQTNDSIKYQLHSEYSPVSMNLLDYKGKVVDSVSFENIGVNIYNPTYFTFEGQLPLNNVNPGCYFLEIAVGVIGAKRFISNSISIKDTHKNSILFEYRNSRYKDDIIYENGIKFQFRVEGCILYSHNALKRYSYETQETSLRLLNSADYEVYNLTIGHQAGVPDWIEPKISKIMNHNEVMIDGKYFTGIEDFAIEQKKEDGTWMRGLTMQVCEGLTRSSDLYLGTGNPNISLIIIHQTSQSVIFGDVDSQSNDTIPVYNQN